MIRDPRQTAPPEAGPRALLVSSDASARLAAARQWIGSLPRDAEALLLASHGHAADEVARVDAADHGARFGLRRATLDRLAFQLAAPALARRGAAPATSLTLAAVVARAVHRLLERGSAGRFAEIAGRPGFPHAAVRTLEELRGAGIGAGNLRAALPDAADLASILEGMEREMGDLRLADRAEVILLAAAAIESGEAFPAPRPLLLLDLAPVQKVEWDLVEALVARSPRVLATAPRGDAAAIARLEAMLGVSATCPDGKEAETSLALLKRHLFEDSGPDPRDMDETVSVASWPGEARECVEIARRIQEEASAGVPFDRMAIFLRSPNSYRSHLEEALRRAAIPAHFARGALRPDPAGRALLALLACAAEGLSARRFAEYLSLGQVPDPSGAPDETWAPPEHELAPAVAGAAAPGSALGSADEGRAPDPDAGISEGGLRAPWRWERLLVDAAVIGGRDRWARRLDGLIEEIALRRKDLDGDDARAAGLERVAADLDHLRAFALPLITRLSELPAGATWAVWLERLRDLTTAALRQPHGVLGVLAELAPLGPVGPVDLVVVQHVLAPRLRDLASPPESRPEGAVFVAPIEMARGLRFDVVFVPGLAEKLFPPRILEDPLLPDEARRALGADLLATQDSRVQEHRLALRLAVGAAGLRAALSWPRVDVEMARARVPSFYGLEAIRAMEGRLPGFDELRGRAETGGSSRLGWPAPENPARAIDDTEYDLAVLGRLKDAGSDAHAGAANYLLAANPHLARALRARGRRWLKKWSYADGLVDPDPDALAALARHRMGARSFSPTALERFASCPYQFFLQAVHRIQPREESEALETIDPLTRGALFHQIQFELLTALRDRGKLPLDPGHLEEADRILEEAAGRVAEEWKEKVAPAIPRVWSDGIGAIRADLREWLRRSTEGAQGWVPHRFELSFGLADRDRPTADASSVPDPVTILDGVRLRGSVDLVERRADGALRVTDHKTGKARVDAGAVVWGGRTLQPLLYALAVEELLQGRVLSGRLYYCTSDGGFEERDIPLNEDHRAAAGVAIGVIGTALEQGFLPAAPRPDACRWCDYRPVCGPNEEVRTARKTRERLEDLERLRDMP